MNLLFKVPPQETKFAKYQSLEINKDFYASLRLGFVLLGRAISTQRSSLSSSVRENPGIPRPS